ncbi:MAG TPA: DUF1015 domain-containing protein [bacterium]|nr:DUF1015 domain-containing protein [bacterium]
MNRFPTIAPFRGLRYDLSSGKLDPAKVTAPPYDVINEDAQRRLYERDPHNVVRVILGHQFPKDTAADNRYTRAAADLERWVREGVLKRDAEPSFYLYEQEFRLKDGSHHVRRGFLALRRLEEFGKGKIQPHEKTLAGPKADRLLLMKSCHANLSPIFSLYSDPEHALGRLLEPHFQDKPLADFADEEGVRQRLWRVSDQALFRKTDEIVGRKNLFIADGHHRYETALAYREWMKSRPEGAKAAEDASFHYVLMFFSDMEDPGLVILPTHRVLHDWPGFDPQSFRKKLAALFGLRAFPDGNEALLQALKGEGARGAQAFGLVLPGEEPMLLTLSAERRDSIPALKEVPAALRAVDTLILHRVIFREMLGLREEDEKDPRFMTFVKDAREALATPQSDAVFLLNTTPMRVLKEVVETGMVLPPKTTFFYPKLLSGLVFHPLSAAERVSI